MSREAFLLEKIVDLLELISIQLLRANNVSSKGANVEDIHKERVPVINLDTPIMDWPISVRTKNVIQHYCYLYELVPQGEHVTVKTIIGIYIPNFQKTRGAGKVVTEEFVEFLNTYLIGYRK